MSALRRLLFLATAALSLPLAAAASGDGRDPDLRELIQQGRERYALVQDYDCILSRKEWIEGKQYYKDQPGIVLKYRKPGSFYFKWTEGPVKGTELIYVQGRDDNRLHIHYTNIFRHLTLAVEPGSRWVTRGNRHSVQEAHLGFFLEMIGRTLEQMQAGREGAISYGGEEVQADRPTLKFTLELPPDRGYYGRTIVVNIDQQLALPVRVEVYGWDGRLWEAYSFSRLRLNPGLGDRDFDLTNTDYGFNGHAVFRL